MQKKPATSQASKMRCDLRYLQDSDMGATDRD